MAHHLGVVALICACVLLAPSWSDTMGGDGDEDRNAGEPIGKTRSGNPGKTNKNRNRNEGKLEKKYNQNQNKNEEKTKRKNQKGKNYKTKASCGFDDNELSINGSARSPVSTLGRYVWANGKIPYYYKGTITTKDKALLRKAMDQIEAKTCFRFEEKGGEPSYHHLEITVGSKSCATSSRGSRFSAYVQAITDVKTKLVSNYQLADRSHCNYVGGVLHELMHVLGVGHTQKRKDRDSYIRINKEEISEYSQYEICSGCTVYSAIPYDCDSIMHYGYTTFRKQGSQGQTMTAINPNTCQLTPSGPAFTGTGDASTSDWNLLNILADKVCQAAASCTGSSSDWGCCTSSSPCQERQGDCDADNECTGTLVCDKDNCKDFHPQAEGAADCCIKPKASCSGTSSDWRCCTSTSPCQQKQGDCDNNSECVGALVCGKDNCKEFNPLAEEAADCCIEPKASCTGSSSEWGCCTSSSPCHERQGDCDADNECAGTLVCGKDNCKDFHSQAEGEADCCIKPTACTGSSSDWACCTSSSPCQERQGDCDNDSSCAGSLVCGTNNCQDFHPGAHGAADCCIKA